MSDERATVVRSPLGDLLVFASLAGRDEISRCFKYTVAFVSTDVAVDPLKMLGKPLSVAVESGDDPHWVSGIVSDFRLTRIEERRAFYAATVRPYLWFLGNTRDCRIFQNLSVPEILQKIFDKYGQMEVAFELQSSYPQRDYCVQYDESDLDFVQRLMEHEGISYYFLHDDGAHKLVLIDAAAKFRPIPGDPTVLYHDVAFAGRRGLECIDAWLPSTEVRPGTYAHTDYDFEKPRMDLATKSPSSFAHDLADGEHYDHPGRYLETARGDKLAGIRREEIQARHRRASGSGTARGLHAGRVFTLDGFPDEAQNAKHLVVSTEIRLIDPNHVSGADVATETYRVTFEAVPASVEYRPARRTRRPIVGGPQTATVVGPPGEEIFTDKYARVKVQFHWDRLGKDDQNSSCFIRVSQTWAGAGWGFIQIPRIGQEVIVDFLEGDPDQPIITGRVYNAAEMPPYGLPGSATQSGLKTNSTPGGGGWNELRFEDKAGSEEVYFQAQKDHNLLIKHNRAKHVRHDQRDRIDNNARHSVGVNLDEDVGNNKTTTVGVDRTVSIGSNDTETVGTNRSLTVGANETIAIGVDSAETIGSNHTQTVGLIQTISVGAARVDSVGAAESRTVGAAQTIQVGLTRSVTVGATQSHTVGANDSWSIGANQSVNVGAKSSLSVGSDASITVGGARSTSVAGDDSTKVGGALALKVGKAAAVEIAEDGSVKVGKKLIIQAADEISLVCGDASIILKKDGTIQIKGKDIVLDGSGKINVKASSDVTIKGSTINQN